MDGNGWVAGIIIDSDDWDHSRKFPAFSTSKYYVIFNDIPPLLTY